MVVHSFYLLLFFCKELQILGMNDNTFFDYKRDNLIMSSSLIVEVCEIKNVQKHPNADALDIVTAKGWNCITKLDKYKKRRCCSIYST